MKDHPNKRSTMVIDGKPVELSGERTILEAALGAGIYIPHLCYHPQLGPFLDIFSIPRVYQGGVAQEGKAGEKFEGCHLCLVEIERRDGLFRSCTTRAEEGISVHTHSVELKRVRQDRLSSLLERHPHDCLLCPQSDGCDRKTCSLHIPEKERCCSQFGICTLQKVADYIGKGKGLSPYRPLNLPILEKEPLIRRDYNLCIGCLRCVRICQEVKGVDALGFTVDDGNILVGSRGATLQESGCQFCGYCIEVCPTGALLDLGLEVGQREAQLVPCKNSCPANLDVPLYIRLIKEKEFNKALEVIQERVPLAGVLGRVCFHPCEINCRRGRLDQPLAIGDLKRFVADLPGGQTGQVGQGALLKPVKERTHKKVAVIGSGPAGLTAAYYLNLLGHSVAVFEALPVKGGMLRVGIPSFRLPREVVDEEIGHIEESGVEIKTDHRVDSLDQLFLEGFEAIFVAIGAHKGNKLGISGEDQEGVIDGLVFLRKVNLGEEISIGERVAIMGGGNVAVDSGRSALRKGATEATLFYRLRRKDMPAYEEEIEAALEEGITIEDRVLPIKIEKINGRLEVEFIRTQMGDLDHTQRPRAVPLEGTEYQLIFDTVILAIGQQPEVFEGFGTAFNQRMKGRVNPLPGVYLGGDLLLGPKTVIEAMASGRRGAILIDHYLGGDGILPSVSDALPVRLKRKAGGVDMVQGRVVMPTLPVPLRISNFSEIRRGWEAPIALAEASRCLECDLRFHIKPDIIPPEGRLMFDEETIRHLPEQEGVYIFYDDQKEVYQIGGVENLREALLEEYQKGVRINYFSYEEDPMFTLKERQLIQQYVKKHGKMPPGNDILDDLF